MIPSDYNGRPVSRRLSTLHLARVDNCGEGNKRDLGENLQNFDVEHYELCGIGAKRAERDRLTGGDLLNDFDLWRGARAASHGVAVIVGLAAA